MPSDSTPFIVTLAVAVLGWTLSHIVDRIENSPTLKYSIGHQVFQGNSIFSLTIKNITADKKFKKFTVVLAAPEGSAFKDAQTIPTRPAFEGDSPWRLAGRTAQFTIPAIEPDGEFKLTGEYTGTKRGAVWFIPDDSDSVKAVEPSFETFLAENESNVLYGLVVVWLVVLAAYFVYPSKRSNVDS